MKFKPVTSPVPGSRAFFTSSNCAIIIAHEPCGPGGVMRHHLSISHKNRYPHWDEIVEARYELLPEGIRMAMILPSREEYVNVHPNCFHLYELESEADSKIIVP